MMRNGRLSIAIAFAGVLGGSLTVIAGPGDVPVTSLVSDYDTGIAPALQIQSDQAGSYQNGSKLTSVVQSEGTWVLDSYNPAKATRKVYLGFNKPIAGTGPGGGAPVAPPSGLYLARVMANCFADGLSMLTLAPGATINCPFHVHFDAGGSTYDIDMNPNNANGAGTDDAVVTCIFPTSSAGPCSEWRITPSGSVINPDDTVTYPERWTASQDGHE